jgi:hypothetical protein
VFAKNKESEIEPMTRPAGKASRRAKKPAASALVIEREELEAFRAQLPEYRRRETFRFLTLNWDIVRALYIVHKCPREAQPIDVAMFAQNYGFPFNEQGDPGGDLPESSNLFFYADPKAARDDRIDTARPVLIALVALSREKPGAMMIDGLHRLYKAAWQGQPRLEAYVLTPEEEQACRI